MALATHAALASWIWLAVLVPRTALAGALLAVIAACGAVRWRVMGLVGRRIGAPDPAAGRLAQLLIALLPPLAQGFDCALFWASLRTRRIRWRHVEYEVAGPNAVRVARRFGHAA